MQVHMFDDTGEAYDICQCDERLKEGDVLLIPDEKVVGIVHCWPIAVTKECGHLHSVKPNEEGTEIDWHVVAQEIGIPTKGIDWAIRFAQKMGW